jgi:hypothetical protein
LGIDGNGINKGIDISNIPSNWTDNHWSIALESPVGSAWKSNNIGFGMTSDGSTSAWYWIFHTPAGPATYPMALITNNSTQETTLVVDGKTYLKDKVRIGATSITAGPHLDYMLSVGGKIVAKDIVVTLTGWSDFVFEENYSRMSVLDKEAFYKKEKHLPNISSAKEIETDGLQVGTTMNGMMQNIEENTLDIADLYKRMLLLEKENSELKESIKMLNEKK